MMAPQCILCDYDPIKMISEGFDDEPCQYDCPRCGAIRMTEEAAEALCDPRDLKPYRAVLSIILRNYFENRGQKPPKEPLKLENLRSLAKQYAPFSPLEQLDHALTILSKRSMHVGFEIKIYHRMDYPLFHCTEEDELPKILQFLFLQGLISQPQIREYPERPFQPHDGFYITAEGYKRLRQLQENRADSRQCFVAMWFSDEMKDAYEKAIKKAIEYKENGKSEPKFKAVKIDNVEHINDINDEIIAQIRRSKFMVCDLTGYRGGVYFEAGFAYGLGLPVIYTCRKDWTEAGTLKDADENEVKVLYDSHGKEIPIKKEGVHFDLAHRNRISWEPDKLDEFRKKLENRVKAVIV